MATKNSPAKRRPVTKEELVEREANPRTPTPLKLKPETRHGVVIVLLLLGAAIGALSVFGLADPIGGTISNAIGTVVGWQRYVTWVYLGVIGYLFLFPERYRLSAVRWVGFGIALIASLGLLHLLVPVGTSFDDAINGQGGGFIGHMFSYPFRTAFGMIATVLIILAIFVVGLLMMLDTTLQSLARRGNVPGQLFLKLRGFFWRQRLAKVQTEVAETEVDEPAFSQHEVADGETETDEAPVSAANEPEQTYVPVKPKAVKRPKRNIIIPIDLLDLNDSRPTSGNIDGNKEKIRKTLETFGIAVEMDDVNVGPTVTQFTLKPAEGVRLAQIASLSNDLALALAAHPIRIEAPIPGKSLVGIEVPNQSTALVNLRDILNANEFKTRSSNLAFSLGKDVSGKPWVTNLDAMPHLLIAGATGSGKSVMVNGLILSLLYSNSPDDLKFILVDPKRVELSLYNGIPHLLTPVITDTTKTINALRWVVSEMDRRYGVLQNAGKRNIASYRKEVNDDMPYIVVVIDELADLMTVAANEVEGAIVRLAQMARAVGIHLVLATQRPSVDVITGLIKANVTARIAFSVASGIDSRTILDTSGAEKLLGKGDMLFVSAELSKPKRLQGAYVGEKEVERVTQFLKTQGQPEYMTDIVDKPAPQIGGSMEDLGDDELLSEAKEVILQADKASASLLQRRLRVGYARAARILDLLEEQGFIGPGEGAKPREVYGHSGGAGLDASPAAMEEQLTTTTTPEAEAEGDDVEESDESDDVATEPEEERAA